MEKKEIVEIGGSVEKAVNGQYSLDVEKIIKESWQLTLSSRSSINLGLLFSFALGILITLLISSSLGGIEVVAEDPQLMMLLNIVITIAIWPFLGGVEMLGVFHAIGVKTQTKVMFSFLKRGSWVAICALLTSTFISIGFSLFIVPGIFLAVSLSLAIPLVIEKKISPIKACWLCVQATRFQWFKIFILYGLLLGGLVLATLPLVLLAESELGIIGFVFLFFALSYLAPLFYHVKGILYREIFGLHVLADAGSVSNQSSSTFIA